MEVPGCSVSIKGAVRGILQLNVHPGNPQFSLLYQKGGWENKKSLLRNYATRAADVQDFRTIELVYACTSAC